MAVWPPVEVRLKLPMMWGTQNYIVHAVKCTKQYVFCWSLDVVEMLFRADPHNTYNIKHQQQQQQLLQQDIYYDSKTLGL